jgi:type II secretion system protein J
MMTTKLCNLNPRIRNAARVAKAGDLTRGLAAWGVPEQRSHRAFTLIEVLLALAILAMVLLVVYSIFHGALQLRNKADEAFDDAIPLQHTLSVMQRDLANLTVPGGTFCGPFQTTPTVGSSTATAVSHPGQQCGPVLYTASGTLDDNLPWSEMRKVTYYLVPASGGATGLDLVRSVSRNLLPVAQDESTDQRLMGGVSSLAFQFYDGTQWLDAWDSTTVSSTGTSNSLPVGIRVQLTLNQGAGQLPAAPIEMVVPVLVGASTNTAPSTVGGGG